MDLFFNITIMTLLLITIIYAVRLNGKLNAIRSHKLELRANIEAFYAATDKATKAVADLQKQGKELSAELDQKVSKARTTSDEIDFMLTRARKTIMSMNSPAAAEPTPVRAAPSFAKNYDTRPQPQLRTLTREQQIEQRLRAANVEIDSSNERKASKDYMSLSEQQLLKAMRDREFKQALMAN
jgi:hypothetical protein